MFVSALLLGMLLSANADPKPLLFGKFQISSSKQLRIKNFEYSDCTDNILMQLTNLTLDIDDDYIIVSGSLSVSENISALSAKVVIKYKDVINWPCKNQIGSCQYNNLCDILNENTDTCENETEALKLKLPCECPITKGEYTLPSLKLPIPDKWKSLMTGKHTAQVTGSIDGQEVLCYKFVIQLSM